MKAPVSACIIVKNEPLLESCLKSIRAHVEEIIVVDTGSTDGQTIEIAKKYADIFEIYTECNDPETGLIENFSQARQRSFDLSSKKWQIWVDADDTIVGGENLNKIIDSCKGRDAEPIVFMFPYEYSYNELGQCTCLHYRERLVSHKEKFHWTNPVHEVLIPNENVNATFITVEDVIYKHQRQYGTKTAEPAEPGRNLRILKNYFEKTGSEDARQMYYLGLECCNAGLLEESIGHLSKYVDISGWDDERAMGCLKLTEIYQARGDYENGLKWGFKTISIKETWGEGYFNIGKMFYYLAQAGGPNEMRNWEKCVYFIRIGLGLPPTKTLLFINPLDREYEIHRYLNMALNKLGDIKGALDSVNIALEKQPNDANLQLNKKIYETFLINQQLIPMINKLKDVGGIDVTSTNTIISLINKTIIPNNIDTNVVLTDGTSPFPVANTSNNSAYWNIPSTIDFDGFPIKLSNDQLQAVVILIWKQYMLHDEVLSAISFLNNAPYNVRYSFAVEKALKVTRACLDWMDNKQEFQDINDPKTGDKEAGMPLPHKLIMSEGHRFDLITPRLQPNSSIVDFGSMDGCFTNRYGMLGHRPVGLDVCENSVNLANKKAIEFNTGAKHICTYFQEAVGKVEANSFDVATSTDTYEHLRDPVNDMLIPAKQMLKPNGKFLLCTPHGAWMRGQYLEWAHPWLWAREGKSWLQPSPRAHLVAPSPWSVAAHFKEAGYYVKNCYADLCDNSNDALQRDVVDQGNIFAEAYVTVPEKQSDLDIVFWIGNCLEVFTPETFKKTGLGGSETMAIEQAKRLATLGNRVRVYVGCGPSGEGIYDGVEYLQTEKFQDLECDVLIVSRYAAMLGDSYNIDAKLKLLWVHDIFAISGTNELLLKADRVLALSEWHKQYLINYHHLHEDHVIVTRNGIDLSRFDKNIKRDQYKCINSSSPDRSWPILLEIWPRIKAQVPQATLTLAYGFKNWELSSQHDQSHKDLIQYLKNKIEELKQLGVNYIDRVSQNKLSEEFLNSGVWLHSTWFTETSCITAMEAQAAGCRMVTSSIAALNETAGERAALVDGDWTSDEYKNKFVEESVKALLNNNNEDRFNLQKYAREHFGLDDLAKDWNKMFIDLIELKKTNPIVPYQPTIPYRIGGQGYYDGDTRIKNK